MWKLKVLSGLHRNQSFELREGVNTLGRGQDNHICLVDKGISKHHAHIVVGPKQVKIVDQNSSNGSFLDGHQIIERTVEAHHRITFYNVLCQIVYEKPPEVLAVDTQDNSPKFEAPADPPASSPASSQDAWEKAQLYLQANILPALYATTKFIDFKWVLALLIAGFVLLSTVLSSVPLVRSLNQSAQTEARIQAQSVAQQLASQNKVAIAQSMHSDLQLHGISRRKGVRAAYIVSADGRVLAPAHQAGQHLNLDYVHTGRQLDKASTSKIKNGFLVAMVPMEKQNPELQVNQIAAFAVVQYNAQSTALNTAYVVSFLIQNFFIILLLGGGLFLLIYCLVQYPIQKLNKQIEESLNKNTNNIGFEYQFAALNELMVHIKSLLTRAQNAQAPESEKIEADRVSELTNLVTAIENPALAILDTEQMASANEAFYSITGLQAADVEHTHLNDLNDQALKLNLQDLVANSKSQASQLASNVLEFNGIEYTLLAQAVFGSQDIAYYIITFKAPE